MWLTVWQDPLVVALRWFRSCTAQCSMSNKQRSNQNKALDSQTADHSLTGWSAVAASLMLSDSHTSAEVVSVPPQPTSGRV